MMKNESNSELMQFMDFYTGHWLKVLVACIIITLVPSALFSFVFNSSMTVSQVAGCGFIAILAVVFSRYLKRKKLNDASNAVREAQEYAEKCIYEKTGKKITHSQDLLCSKIRNYRAENRMKLQEFGDKVGLTKEQVWGLEKNEEINLTTEERDMVMELLNNDNPDSKSESI